MIRATFIGARRRLLLSEASTCVRHAAPIEKSAATAPGSRQGAIPAEGRRRRFNADGQFVRL